MNSKRLCLSFPPTWLMQYLALSSTFTFNPYLTYFLPDHLSLLFHFCLSFYLNLLLPTPPLLGTLYCSIVTFFLSYIFLVITSTLMTITFQLIPLNSSSQSTSFLSLNLLIQLIIQYFCLMSHRHLKHVQINPLLYFLFFPTFNLNSQYHCHNRLE